jgi:hypothetical protein
MGLVAVHGSFGYQDRTVSFFEVEQALVGAGFQHVVAACPCSVSLKLSPTRIAYLLEQLAAGTFCVVSSAS